MFWSWTGRYRVYFEVKVHTSWSWNIGKTDLVRRRNWCIVDNLATILPDYAKCINWLIFFLVLALSSHLLTCARWNCQMMFSNVFNKIFESDECPPTSEIFLITLFCCIFDWFGNLLLTHSKFTSYVQKCNFFIILFCW